MNIDANRFFGLARAAHAYHKAHRRVAVAVTQQTDALWIRLHVPATRPLAGRA